MKIIGLEEHWCPRELFEKEGTPGYDNMSSVKTIQSPDQFEETCNVISDIGSNRIKMMDSVGLSMQILSLCSANMELLPDDEAIYYSTHSNNILAEGIANNPDRFCGLAAIPTGNPDAAAKEIKRCKKLKGFVGVIINGHIKEHYLDEPQFEPILSTAESLNMPLYIHPAIPPKKIIDTYYKMNDAYAQTVLTSGGWGWHIETGTHVLRMIASGVFDRHPNLKVIIGHLGEGIPFFMERLKNATGGNLKHPYQYYLKKNIYYTISGFNYPDLFTYVLKEVGSSHLMFSTDFPFSSAKVAVDFINKIDIEESTRNKIAFKNAKNLFDIKLS